jgi:hypothetical protein
MRTRHKQGSLDNKDIAEISELRMSTCKKFNQTTEDQRDFYSKLSEELIDNKYDRRGKGGERTSNDEPDSPVNSLVATDGSTRYGVGIHCTPTKKMRATRNGDFTKSRL